ncbi:hypothetical protein F3Y22_tig00111095pilonHSYRG00629 [Hibiscus syriacus]|uniref:Pentatricopeptide repeat-containing protein n=1 Tax=Hibiscus syriacus TaxID=106335 RepID=A0A6A2Z2A0_HIBSY|nr:hypothetical protein F3Y22_tig00111095pilonHSYRG00629 [Hibiscus syriacus]
MLLRNCFSWNTVIEGYMKPGNKKKTLELLKLIPRKNDYSWNLILSGFVKANELEVAGDLFDDMPRKNAIAFHSACADLEAIEYGNQIHAHMVVGRKEFDPVSCSSLINLYGKCGDLDGASRALHLMMEPDQFALSPLISGYATSGRMTDT